MIYGQSFLYRVDVPGDRDRAIAQLRRDFDTAAERYGFTDRTFTVCERPALPALGDYFSYLTWRHVHEADREE